MLLSSSRFSRSSVCGPLKGELPVVGCKSFAAVCTVSLPAVTYYQVRTRYQVAVMNSAVGLLPVGNDKKLLQCVFNGNFERAKVFLEAGASVNGPPEQPFSPIVGATIAKHAGMVNFLLEQGADPDRPVNLDLPCAIPGERVLHIAARGGKVEIVRVLLNRSRADFNATDSEGRTPLMAACSSLQARVEVVRLLLEAGADPAPTALAGHTPLHSVAQHGHIDLVDMLYSRAPATLNVCAAEGQTPLFVACSEGHESMVSKLLSLGAMQPVPPDPNSNICPLQAALAHGYFGVLRILINEGGIRAVGGERPLTKALFLAIRFHQARVLQLLLTAYGEERRSEWASVSIGGRHLLHYGAGYCYPAAVSILLEAGADEEVRDLEGRFPRDAVGVELDQDDGLQLDRGKEVAVRRMLRRGPAYRARSWAWPADPEDVHAGNGGGDDPAAAAPAAAAAILASPPAVPKASVMGVRIFRPMEASSSELFVRVVSRYCAKD